MAAGAGVASLGLGLLIALALGYLRGGFGRAEQLAAATGLPVLGVVPELGRRERASLDRWSVGPAAVTAMRSLAYVLASRRPPSGHKPVTLLLTSAVDGEGKSFCAAQLATALAGLNARVLLVELDFWGAPAPTRWPPPRLQTVTTGQAVSEGGQNLDVLAIEPGLHGEDPGAALRGRLASLKAMGKSYDFVVLDGPAAVAVPDLLPAATHADETLLVVRFERTRAGQVDAALDRLAAVGVRPLGTLLSRVVPEHYRRYGYGKLG
jgi:Mrp family chromosome partitioning ATPase